MQSSRPPSPSEPPAPARLGNALDRVNDAFHEAYDDARGRAERRGPVLVVLADVLVAVHGEERREARFAPPLFHLVKSVAHAPVALYALLSRSTDRDLDEPVVSTLRARAADLEAAAPALAEVEAPLSRDLEAILAACRDLARTTLASGGVAASTLERFAKACGAVVLRLTHAATDLQLRGLHERTEEALAELAAEDVDALQVVVTGDHQARARSLAMQYFQARFGEGEGTEERVTYGERVETEEDALALVGTRRLDRTIARAFFGDERRLQRDVLGDAAAVRLREMKLTPIGER